jgi:hypothetical protein
VVQRLSREIHPSVQRRGALLAATTGLDPHSVRDSLDCVAEADFLIDEETRETNAVRLTLRPIPLTFGCPFPLHDTLAP